MSIAYRIERLHAQRMAEMRAESERLAALNISATTRHARAAALYVHGHPRIVELLDMARQRRDFDDIA